MDDAKGDGCRAIQGLFSDGKRCLPRPDFTAGSTGVGGRRNAAAHVIVTRLLIAPPTACQSQSPLARTRFPAQSGHNQDDAVQNHSLAQLTSRQPDFLQDQGSRWALRELSPYACRTCKSSTVCRNVDKSSVVQGHGLVTGSITSSAAPANPQLTGSAPCREKTPNRTCEQREHLLTACGSSPWRIVTLSAQW